MLHLIGEFGVDAGPRACETLSLGHDGG